VPLLPGPLRQGRIFLWVSALLAVPVLIALHHGVGANDSCIFRAGAMLCGPQLYRSNLQHELIGAHTSLFWRAPFYAWMLRPLLWFNFPQAWLVLNLASVAGIVLLLPKSIGSFPYPLSLIAVFFAPLVYNVSIEQDGAIVLLILSLTLAAEAAGFPLVAGAILAFTLEKPSLFLLLPVVIAMQRRWRMLYGYLGSAAVLILLSLWIVGPSAIGDYIHIVSEYTQTPEKMPTARGIAAVLHMLPLWPALSVAAAAATIWKTRVGHFRAAFCTGIVASLFISPESYAHDLSALLLPVLYFLFNGSRFQRVLAGLWFVPLVPYVYIHYSASSVSVSLLVALFLAALTFGGKRSGNSEAGRRAEMGVPDLQAQPL
jgi:hypothetical protein